MHQPSSYHQLSNLKNDDYCEYIENNKHMERILRRPTAACSKIDDRVKGNDVSEIRVNFGNQPG